jgi:hypothetical protein
MRRVIAIALASASLAGCSSFSWDYFKSAQPTVAVPLESSPPGADARTSLGPGCKTPCTVTVPVPEGSGFTVTFALNKQEPVTVPVQVIRTGGDLMSSPTITVEPSPVFAELRPPAPPPRGRKTIGRPKKPRAPKNAAAPAADTPFPAPQ